MRLPGDYLKLMEFVSKNKAIPSGIARVRADSSDILTSLRDKINHNTLLPTDMVFNDLDCELYILALLQNKEIKEMKAYTLLEYIQMLRQYTDRQSLKPEDQHNFKYNGVTVSVKILTVNELANLSKKLSEQFREAGSEPVSRRCIKEVYNALEGCEKWVFDIKYSVLPELLVELALYPWVVMSDKNILHYLSPAFNLGILQLFNKACPVAIQHCFGTINSGTLTRTIRNGYRPVSLYSNQVSSNLKSAHSAVSGPVIFTLHDWYHISSVVFLLRAPDAFQLIFSVLEPALHKVFDTKSAQGISDVLGDLSISNVKRHVGRKKTLNADCLEILLRDLLFYQNMTTGSIFYVYIQLYRHFFNNNQIYHALNGKSINEFLTDALVYYNQLVNKCSIAAAIILFNDKFDAVFSRFNLIDEQEALSQHADVLERRIKLVQRSPSNEELFRLMEEALLDAVEARKASYGSFFATHVNHCGPFRDCLNIPSNVSA